MIPILAEGFLDNDLQKNNIEAIKKLKNSVERRELALCLGAGVGVDIGLPLWTSLINKLLIRISLSDNEFKPQAFDQEALCKAKIFENVNVLERAEYARIYLEEKYGEKNPKMSEVYLKEVVRDILQREYEHFPDSDRNPKLLKSIAALIAHESGVKHILTYNYDDALEHYLKQHPNVSKGIISIKSLGPKECVYKLDNEKQRRIYHVHGRIYIKYTKEQEEASDENSGDNKFMLSESSYRNEEVRFTNTTSCQVQLMSALNCLFIGWSGQDDNFRRIIQKRDVNDTEHFIAFSINSVIKGIYNMSLDKILHDCDELANNTTQYHLLQASLKLQRQYYNKYKITPIFFLHDELIPKQQCGFSTSGEFRNEVKNMGKCQDIRHQGESAFKLPYQDLVKLLEYITPFRKRTRR